MGATANRVPGPTCQASRPELLDAGTRRLACSAAPLCTGHTDRDEDDLRALRWALAALQAEAQSFAWRFINDAGARAAYVQRIAAMSEQVMADVVAGRASAAEGAKFANAMRNTIMEEIRAATSAIGRAGAEATKAAGLTLDEAIEKAVRKLYPGKSFGSLSSPEKRRVFLEVIEASGRSSPRFTSSIPRWTNLGRGLVVVTVAISAVNIWMAENKVKQGIKEGATLAGGALGAAAVNASAGFLCGPGAPVCVTVLFVVGGVTGALLASAAADEMLALPEVMIWLGD